MISMQSNRPASTPSRTLARPAAQPLASRLARLGKHAVTAMALTGVGLAHAGGMTMHMFQSERGAYQIEDAALKQLMTTYREAWISGAQYPDAGYVPGTFGKPKHVWGEASHWSPFIEVYLQEVKARCFGRYTTDAECGRLTAHFLGTAAHGIQDQVFDGLFIPKVTDVDNRGQEDTDLGLDMVVLRDHDRSAFIPRQWYTPTEVLVQVYRTLGYTETEANAKQINQTTQASRLANIGERIVAPLLAGKYRQRMPWGSRHYMHYPGGVNFAGTATYHLWRHLWNRLNERPTPGMRILHTPGINAIDVAVNRPDSDNQIGIVFDRAIIPASVTPQNFRITDADGHAVPGRFSVFADPYGTRAEAHMIRFRPSIRLAPATRYTVTVTDGIQDESGRSVTGHSGYSWQFTTEAANRHVQWVYQGKCLGITDETTTPILVDLRPCHASRQQHWFSDTTGQLRNRYFPHLCLDAMPGPWPVSKKVSATTCRGEGSQRWRYDMTTGHLTPGVMPSLTVGALGIPPDGTVPRLFDKRGAPGWQMRAVD